MSKDASLMKGDAIQGKRERGTVIDAVREWQIRSHDKQSRNSIEGNGERER